MSLLSRNVLQPSEVSNYLVGGNLCNAFAIGDVGSPNDFWMVGAPSNDEYIYPLITGNFLDSEGNNLFKLVRNILVVNPKDCGKISGEHIGFEIHDGTGHSIMRIRTTQEPIQNLMAAEMLPHFRKAHPEAPKEMLATSIEGTFFNAQRERAVWTNEDGNLEVGKMTPAMFGFTGEGWGANFNATDTHCEVAKWIVRTHGAISEMLSGEIKGQKLVMDGKPFKDVSLVDCELGMTSGEFASIGKFEAKNCKLMLGGPAAQIAQLLGAIKPGTE